MIVPSPTMRDPITEEDLQSYVDGFLDPVRRAAVEAYLAVNPDESDRTDAYRAQRIGMHVLFDANPGTPLPKDLAILERRLSRAMTNHRSSRRFFRTAASLMTVLVAGGAGWWASQDHVFDGGTAASAWVFIVPHFLLGNETLDTGAISDEESRFVGWLTHNSAADSSPVPDLRALGFNFTGGRVSFRLRRDPRCNSRMKIPDPRRSSFILPQRVVLSGPTRRFCRRATAGSCIGTMERSCIRSPEK